MSPIFRLEVYKISNFQYPVEPICDDRDIIELLQRRFKKLRELEGKEEVMSRIVEENEILKNRIEELEENS